MTTDEIRSRVEKIRDMADDDESAHCAEDRLWQEVLEAIANGTATDPAACAEVALETRDIDFSRWYA